MSEWSSFAEIIKEFIQLFDALISVEQTKLDSAVANKVSFVEECMNKEQAAILKLRGLENKREAEQARLGAEGLTFRQILANVSEEDSLILKPLFEELSGKVQDFQSISSSAREMIELNLHNIRGALHAKDGRNFTSRSV